MGTMYAWFQRLAQGRCCPCSKKILNTMVEFLKKYTTAQWAQFERAEWNYAAKEKMANDIKLNLVRLKFRIKPKNM